MKVLVLNNNRKENEMLMNKFKEMYYDVPIFEVEKIAKDQFTRNREVDEQNKIFYDIISSNPNWVFVGFPETSLDFIASSSSSIIVMDYAVQIVKRRFSFLSLLQRTPTNLGDLDIPSIYTSDFLKEFYKKYARNIIIIKKRKDFKALINALDKHMDL